MATPPMQRGSLACSASSHGPEMSTPDVVELVLEADVEADGIEVALDGVSATSAQRGSFACSASSHGPEMSTPDVVELVLDTDVEADGIEVAVCSTWVVDVVLSVESLPLNTVAPAVALTPTAARAAAASIVRICRCILMVVSKSMEGRGPHCLRARPIPSPGNP